MPLALLRGNCPSILIDRSLSEVSKRQAGNCRERPCKSPGNTQRLAVIIALVVVIIVPQDPEVCPDSQRVSGQAKITMMMMTMTTVIVAILIVIVNKIDKSLNK